MVPFPGTSPEPGSCILDQLQEGRRWLADTSVKGVAVIKLRGDEIRSWIFLIWTPQCSIQHNLPHSTPGPPGWHWDHWCCTLLVYIVSHWPPTIGKVQLREHKSGWLSRNFLKLNGINAEVFLISSKTTTHPSPSHHHQWIPCTLLSPSQEPLRHSGHHNFICTPHSNITRTAFLHLRHISRLRPSLSQSSTEILVHSFVISRIHDCKCPPHQTLRQTHQQT